MGRAVSEAPESRRAGQARVDAEKALVALKQGNDKGAEALQAVSLSFSALCSISTPLTKADPLAQTLFTLPQGKSSYGMATNAQGDIVLIALDSVTPRSLDDQQRKAFVDQLNQGG